MGVYPTRKLRLSGIGVTVGDLELSESDLSDKLELARDFFEDLVYDLPLEGRLLWHSLNTPVKKVVDAWCNGKWLFHAWDHGFAELPEVGNKPVVFESSQGMMLDSIIGEDDHRTSTRVFPNRAYDICEELGTEPVTIGVIRTYCTRHGKGDLSSGITIDCDLNDSNLPNSTQGEFRASHWGDDDVMKIASFGWPLAVNHVDQCQIPEGWQKQVCIKGYGPVRSNKSVVSVF